MYRGPTIIEWQPGDIHLCSVCNEDKGTKAFMIHNAPIFLCPRCAKEVIAKLQDAFPEKEKPSELPLFVKAMQGL